MKSPLRTALLGTSAVVAMVLVTAGTALADPTPTPGPWPSGSPSGNPSAGPSSGPSTGPSAGPSTGPTSQPSTSPTPRPSGSPTPPATTGILTGTLTTASGKPLASAFVNIQSLDGSPYYSTYTDAAGHYEFKTVEPETYRLQFNPPQTSLVQFYPHKINFGDAAPVTVAAGRTTTADDSLLPTGTITGHFTDRAGKPVAAKVNVSDSTLGASVFGYHTDDTGAYRVTVFAGGNYAVQFEYGSGVRQYAKGQTDESKATKYPVAADATVVVDDIALPTGSVSGRLLDNDGSPVARAQVLLDGATSGQWQSVMTSDDGAYRFEQVLVGDYTVRFNSSDYRRWQWAFGKTDRRRADKITVKVDENTTVDDVLVPTGSLSVTATDASTGQPLADFCVYLSGGGTEGNKCADGAGRVTLTDVPAGTTYWLLVSGNDNRYLSTELRDVAVAAGQTSTKSVSLQPAASIETAVVDATTHQPVAGVCVSALSVLGDRGGEQCSDDQGKVRLTYLSAGAYHLFARPKDGVHGAQWVGASGGTGDRRRAQKIEVAAGAVATAPTISLDGAGVITGTVTDRKTRKPVRGACVSTTAVSGGFSYIGYCPGAETDAKGRYTIADLGPYAWPVEFASADTYAWQWFGGAADRLHAKPVKVRAGKRAAANAKLSPGTTVKGTVTDGKGAPLNASVTLVNTVTGDAAGADGDTYQGPYEVHMLPQTLRLAYYVNDDGRAGWYREASDFAHATPIPVGDRPVTVDVVVPAS
jgi:hypothetical protein